MVEPTTFSERYELRDKLATGGMGTVYVAMDTRLERRVALKLMKKELAADPRFVERFRREARSAGALSHPNVAGVYDYGVDQDMHFIVMELVEGRDLARLLREDGPLPEERARTIAAQIADALGHAHAAGVVHRDVKPANVIVGPGDRVKVTDFGIARAQADTALTATGSLLGTAQYISPEQASGADVTTSSDIYSLGIVLFEMLTGSVPFTGDSAVSVAMRHISDRVPPPSSLQPGVSEEMDRVVRRATGHDPLERYADAAAFASALRSPEAGDTRAATTVLAGTGGSTAVMAASGTTSTAPEQWPFPGHPPRWDPRTLGRVVLAIFVGLILVAAALVAIRLAEQGEKGRQDGRTDRANDGQPAPPETPAEEEPAAPVNELPLLEGLTYEEAIEELDALGIASERNDSPNSEYEPGVVFATTPAAGTEVSEGDTVTLFVSTGPAEQDPEEGGEDGEFVPPGQQKKDKDEEEDD